VNSGSLFIESDASLGAAGSTLTINGGQLGTGSTTTINRPVVLGAAGGTVFGAGSTLTFAQPIQGPGSLTISSGIIRLVGTNTYTGGTVVNGSGLTGTTNTIQGNVTLNGVTNTYLEFDQNVNGTYAGNIGGTGGDVLLRGTGIVSFTGNNTYSADTTMYAGVLEVGATGGNLSPSTRVAFNGRSVLQIVGGGSFTRPPSQVLFNSTGGFAARNGNLVVNLGGSGMSLDAFNVRNLLFGSPTANSVTEFQNPITFTTAPFIAVAVDVDVGVGGDYTVLSGIISGPGPVTKLGNGRLVLTAANTYAGVTTVAAGTLQIAGGADRLPTSSRVNFTGGTLDLNGFNQTINGLSTGTGLGVITTGVPGTVTLTVGNGNSSTTFGGTIQDGAGTISFVKVGTGTQTQSGTNTYTGGTTLSGGVLSLASTGALGTIGSISFGGGTLQYSTSNTTDYSPRFNTAAGQAYRLDTNGQTVTLAGDLTSPGGNLTKLGTGTLSLTGANSYSGGTTISAGTLSVGSTAALGSTGTISFAGGTLQFTAANTTDYSPRFSTAALQPYRVDTNGQSVTLATALISSGGSLTKLGTGTLTLTADNTYTGGTTVGAGTLALGSAGALGSTGMITFGGGALQFSAANATDYSNRFSTAASQAYQLDTNGQAVTLATALISSGGSLTKLGAGTLTPTATNTYTGSTSVLGGVLSVGQLANGGVASTIGQSTNAAANLNFANGGILRYTGGSVSTDRSFTLTNGTASGGGFEVTQAGTTLTLTGIGTGTGAFLKNGPGTLLMSGASTYAGGTAISGGTILLNGSNRLPTTGSVTFTGGTFDLNGNDQTIGALASLDGAGLITTGAAGGGLFWVGNGGGSGSYSGIIQDGSGILSLTKTGAGTQTLTGANTYTGGTGLFGGTLTLGSAGAIGTAGTISFSGGTLQFTAANTNDYSARFNTAANQAYRLDTNGQSVTAATVLSSVGGSLTKLGAGTLTVTATNTYGGPTAINGGVLSVNALANGGVASPIGLSSNADANLNFANGGLLRYTGPTLSIDRGFTLNAGGGGFEIENAATTLTVFDSGTGTGGFVKAGPGTLVLADGFSPYSGGTTISAGTLQIGNGGPGGSLGFGNVANNGILKFNLTSNATVNGVVSGTGSLLQSGPGIVFLTATNTYTGGTTIDAGVLQVGPAALGTGAVANAGSLIFNIPGTATQANPISGTGAITKIGTGSLTLTGTSTYTGPTTINAGTLIAGGPSAFGVNSAVSVSAGATLSVNGNSMTYGSLAGAGTLNNNANPAVTLIVGTDNTSTTFSGLLTDGIGGPLAVTKVGTGTLTLTGRAANTRGYAVSGGTLDLIGALVQPGSGSLNAASGTTIRYDGAQVLGGFVRGPGTHILTGGATLSGVSVFNSTTLTQSGPATLANVTLGGTLTTVAGQTLTWDGGTITASGFHQVNGTANVTDLSSIGRINVNPGGRINSTGSALILGGGSVTNVGVYNPSNGQVTAGGTINVGAQNLVVQGGLMRNNGTITGTSSSRLVVDFGGVARGVGDYDLGGTILLNGGLLLAGNSPGLQRQSNLTLSGGTTGGDLNNATGTVGGFAAAANGNTANSGWSAFEYGNSANDGGGLSIQRTAGGPTQWRFRTTVNDGIGNTTGAAANFSTSQPYSWLIFRPRTNADAANPTPTLPADQINTVATITLLDSAGTVLPNTNENLNTVLAFDRSQFLDPTTGNPILPSAGTFAFTFGPDLLGNANRSVFLSFTPVPEPGLLLAAAAGAMAFFARRRGRRVE
jgi:fibronectin-binding autotransporter adhesin